MRRKKIRGAKNKKKAADIKRAIHVAFKVIVLTVRRSAFLAGGNWLGVACITRQLKALASGYNDNSKQKAQFQPEFPTGGAVSKTSDDIPIFCREQETVIPLPSRGNIQHEATLKKILSGEIQGREAPNIYIEESRPVDKDLFEKLKDFKSKEVE